MMSVVGIYQQLGRLAARSRAVLLARLAQPRIREPKYRNQDHSDERRIQEPGLERLPFGPVGCREMHFLFDLRINMWPID